MNSREEKETYRELPIGAVLTACTSSGYNTGNWRTFKPIWDEKRCIHCLQCWLYCPDFSVLIKEGKMSGFDYRYCKGCGLCAYTCPVKGKAISMVKETEA